MPSGPVFESTCKVLRLCLNQRQHRRSIHVLSSMLPYLLLAFGPLFHPAAPATVPYALQEEVVTQQPEDDLPVPEGVLQDAGDEFVLDLSELDDAGLTLRQFIKICQINTGLNFTLDESTQAGIRDKLDRRKLLLYGPKRIKKDDFYSFFQIMMKIHGFVCVQQGTGSLAVVVIVEDLASNGKLIKANAPFVEEKDIIDFANKPGSYLFTVVRVAHADATDLGNSLRTVLGANAGDSSAFMALPQESALLIQGYGPFVAAAVRMIKVIDVEQDLPRPVFKKIRLREADAVELAELVQTLTTAITEVDEQRSRNQRNQAQTVRVETVVEAYEQDNSLLITASSENIDQILELVSQLDTRVENPESNFHVFQLQNLSVYQLEGTGGDNNQDGSGSAEGDSFSSNLDENDDLGIGFRDFFDNVVSAEEEARDAGQGGNGSSRRSAEQRPEIGYNSATNTVLVSATRSKWAEIHELLKLIDKPQPQVLVQAALIEVTDDFSKEIGFEYAAVDLPEGQDSEHFVFSSVGITTAENIGDARLPSPTAAGLTYGIFDGEDLGIPMILQAVQNEREANVLSVPSVLVTNNQAARVEAAESVPIPSSNAVQGAVAQNFNYEDAGIMLEIRPSIASGKFLRMDIYLEVSAFREQTDPNVPPDKTKRVIRTEVTLPDGATMWLGGIKRNDYQRTEQGIPFLSDIPLVGWLFGKTSTSTVDTTLFFFCTPRIIDDFAELEDLSNEGKAAAAETIGLERVRMIDPDFELESPEDVILDEDVNGDGVDDVGSLNMPAFAAPAYSTGGGVVDPAVAGATQQRVSGAQG